MRSHWLYLDTIAWICPVHGQKIKRHRGWWACRKTFMTRKTPFDWRHWYENGGREKIVAASKRNPNRREWVKRGKALRRGAKRGYWVTKRDIERLWNRQNRQCAYCPTPITLLTAQQDHVIPVSRGGVHSIGNIVLACGPCNGSKSDKLPIRWYRERRYWSGLVERARRAPERGDMVLADTMNTFAPPGGMPFSTTQGTQL